MGRPAVSNDKRARIQTLLLEGRSHGAIAKEVGVSHTTVGNFAKEKSIKPAHAAPQVALAAKKEYDAAGRAALSNELFDRIRALVADPNTRARDIKDLALAFGICTDKRRLEEGESTSRSEQHYSKGLDLEQEFRALDDRLEAEGEPDSEAAPE